jgi:hypothetical protein
MYLKSPINSKAFFPPAPLIGSDVSKGALGVKVACPKGAGLMAARNGAAPVAVVPVQYSRSQPSSSLSCCCICFVN